VRDIRGWVVRGQVGPKLSVLYGRGVSLPQVYESIETNGLAVWPDLRMARAGLAEIQQLRSDIRYPALQHLQLQVAEDHAELETFQRRRSLIVILPGEPNEMRLFGPFRPGCTRVCDRLASLFENGFTSFLRFEDAEYAAREMSRQCVAKVTLATFLLR
jgi:hypothetical protein